MTTLQEWLDNKHPTLEAKQGCQTLFINESIVHTELEDELEIVDGGGVNLSNYSNLIQIEIDGNYLKSSITKLILGKQDKLEAFVCLNNPQLTNLDVSQCPNLERIYCDNLEEKKGLTGMENTKNYRDFEAELESKINEELGEMMAQTQIPPKFEQ